MTQVIAAMTAGYVFLASDMRLTDVNAIGSPRLVDPFLDECKLVNTANLFGVGYTGWAKLEGIPVHEWIGLQIAERECMDMTLAAIILRDAGNIALARRGGPIRQEFLIAGWVPDEQWALRARMYLVSNCFHANGRGKVAPDTRFEIFDCDFRPDAEPVTVKSVGFHLTEDRQILLTKDLSRLAKANRSPAAALIRMAEEVVYTSAQQRITTVGDKVMGFCLPKRAAQRTIKTGGAQFVSGMPVADTEMSCFYYFEPGSPHIRHYGPTFTCRGKAMTDLEGHNELNEITVRARVLR